MGQKTSPAYRFLRVLVDYIDLNSIGNYSKRPSKDQRGFFDGTILGAFLDKKLEQDLILKTPDKLAEEN